jgi:hypothetical protein
VRAGAGGRPGTGPQLRVAHTAELTPGDLRAVRGLLDGAFPAALTAGGDLACDWRDGEPW